MLAQSYQTAETYLRAAVNSSFAIQEKARTALDSLLLEQKPEKFFKTVLSRTERGVLQVQITNMGPVKLMATHLKISISNGILWQDRFIDLEAVLVPKQMVRVQTIIISRLSEWTSGKYRAKVINAMVLD